MNNIGKARYGLVDVGVFGLRVVSGVVTGIRYTEDKPLYEISFGNNSWWTSDITDNIEELFKLMKIPPLDRVRETHGLKIKFGK